ncbi:MAG: virulence factor SrfC family protein [Pseudomonadota bacterium]
MAGDVVTDLGDALADLDRGAQDACTWLDDLRGVSTSVTRQADSLVEAARRARLTCRRLSHAVKRNNCVGVFGPSQAGKSYLVSALARPQDGRLTIRFGEREHDFLRDINPPGDRESTGLVTRFTIRPGEVDPDYPVEARLLSETDIVKILANSFFLDFDPNSMTLEPVEEQDIREALRNAEAVARPEPAGHLDEIALFDLCEYFRQNFRSRIGAFDRADFWSGLIKLGGRLSLRDRAALFEVLWGRITDFTAVYVHLAEALDQVGHAPDAQIALAGLVPREKGTPPEPNSIIDVAVLSRLQTDADAKDEIPLRPVRQGKAEAEVALPRATLTALIAEVRLVIDRQPWPFFEHTDLLDFPGARSRLKLTHLPPEMEQRGTQIRELFLRGKIAYLFQRYTDELELTSMLLCMPPSVNEVKDLAGMVRSWITATHGAMPEQRKAVRNALFLVLTKHDLEFLEKGGETADSRLSKWDRRLHASLLELYGKDGWPTDWDGAPFANTYFLRNPGMKQMHLMDYADEETLTEAGPRQSEAFEAYRAAFLGSEMTDKHFRRRERVWDAAMQPNDGGVRFLVESLGNVLEPGLKRAQAAERLVGAASSLRRPLSGLYHAEGAEARRKKDEALLRLRKELFARLNDTGLREFSHLLRGMMLSAADMRGVFLNVAALREDELTEDAASPAPDPFDADPWADPDPADTGAIPEPASRRDRPDIYADRVMNLWASKLRGLQQNDVALRKLGMTAELVGAIVDELLIGASRQGLFERIGADVRLETQSVGGRWIEAADRVAGITATHLNDFVAYLGYSGADVGERPAFPEPPRDPQRQIFTAPADASLSGQRATHERTYFMDWGVALRAFGNDNLGHSAGREISDAQNQRLGEILSRIDLTDLAAVERAHRHADTG